MEPSNLRSILQQDYPEFTFLEGDTFSWSPATKEISYVAHDDVSLLHELAHAVLGHSTYRNDIELVAIERDAWQYAQTTLAPHYHLTISDENIAAALDSYREWLHKRSVCPQCGAVGHQRAPSTYSCVACQTSWNVNAARTCQLRRTKNTPLR